MFDEKKVDRIVEMFVFDIFIAILKIKDTAKDFENVQDLLYGYRDWDSFVEDSKYLDFVVKELQALKGLK